MNGSVQPERLVTDQDEYAALTGFLAQANGFRFTVLGLFLAAAGFVLQQPARWTALLILVLSVLLWGSELRTRAILDSLIGRGRQLERTKSDSASRIREQPPDAPRFIDALGTMENQRTWIGPPPRQKGGRDRRRLRLPLFVSHTMMFDLIYLVVAAYSALVFLLGPESFQSPPD